MCDIIILKKFKKVIDSPARCNVIVLVVEEENMLKIGDLSKITDVSVKTIRFYEEEGLIRPIEVDRWTGYRYYDDSSIERISQIVYLKSLGFTLKEIANFSDEIIAEKTKEIQDKVIKLNDSIRELKTLRQQKGEYIMKNFVNDEKVIGKWKRIGIVEQIEDFKKGNIDIDSKVFDKFKEIYFLPNGQEYWTLSWSKEKLFVKDRVFAYKIIDGVMYIGVVDKHTDKVDCYAVYEQVDNKAYSVNEIMISDDTNIPFIYDEKVVGFWEVVDFVNDKNKFDTTCRFAREELFLKNYAFSPDGKLIATFDRERTNILSWSKGCVINNIIKTVSEYEIRVINNKDYMFVEWKSGDYTYGGKVYGYYVLKRIIK